MTTRIRAERFTTSNGPRWYLDQTRWVDLPGLDPTLDHALTEASGWGTHERPLDDPGTKALVDLLARVGMTSNASPGAVLRNTSVCVVGTGGLARGVARSLLLAGVRRLWVLDAAPPADRSSSRPSPAAAALVTALRPRLHVVTKALCSPDDMVRMGTDLVVVATDTAEPDRLLLDGLVRLDLCHLVVTCGPETARVGPLVLPGRTPCMGCADLLASEHDPWWPQVLAQLTAARVRPDAVLAGQVASRVALEARWLAADMARSDRLDGRMELVDAATPHAREVRFLPHPACPCGLAETA